MILDQALTMSNRQALLATDYSTDTIDLGQAYPIGTSSLSLYIHVNAEGGTTPTLLAELETSSENSTFTKAVGITKPTGKKAFGIPLRNLSIKRYLRLRYVLAGTSPSYTITASLVAGEQYNEALPDSPRQA